MWRVMAWKPLPRLCRLRMTWCGWMCRYPRWAGSRPRAIREREASTGYHTRIVALTAHAASAAPIVDELRRRLRGAAGNFFATSVTECAGALELMAADGAFDSMAADAMYSRLEAESAQRVAVLLP